jgi:hypothetical protein
MTQNPEPFDPAKGGTQDRTENSSSGTKVVRLKKPHPCGGREFTLIRESVIATLKCNTCGSIVRMERGKFIKAIKKKGPDAG